MTQVDCPGCENDGTLWECDWADRRRSCIECGWVGLVCDDCGEKFSVVNI